MASFDRRVDELERAFRGSEDAYSPDPDLIAVLDELSALKSSRAVRYRAGQRIEPEDIPAKLLGPDYSRRELLELAISRAFEKQGRPAREIAELIETWLARFEDFDRLRADGKVR
jgi:hypothetical protein